MHVLPLVDVLWHADNISSVRLPSVFHQDGNSLIATASQGGKRMSTKSARTIQDAEKSCLSVTWQIGARSVPSLNEVECDEACQEVARAFDFNLER